MRISYTEKLIYTLHKPYRWVDKMLKMWIRGYELALSSVVKKKDFMSEFDINEMNINQRNIKEEVI